MTYPELLTSLYKKHDRLLPLWQQSVREAGESGVFAFLPDVYGPGSDLESVRFEFWTSSRLAGYLRENGSSEEGFAELEDQADRAGEFLVLIIEPPEADGRRPVHIHRVGALDHN
jgi:hypothetical protein